MNGIVPRWEWRTFGEGLEDAASLLAGLGAESVQESDEVYLLSTESDASVKTRDGLLDVKELRQTAADGLEQWLPALKAAAPLSAVEIGAVFSALGIETPPLAHEVATLDALVELAGADPRLLAVAVHKRRAHFTVGRCPAELTEVTTGAGATRTIAVESEDPSAVSAAVSSLGLESRRIVSFPRGLATLVGFRARRYAVIDVGTNSVKLMIGERRADRSWLTLTDRAEVTRLGEGLDASGLLGDEPIERTVRAISAMVDEAGRAGVIEIAAVGTAGLRIASNREQLVAEVLAETGVVVEVIPGGEEARLAYFAVTAELALRGGELAVFDTGGGSSQFTFGRSERIEEQFSVEVGAARFTDRFHLDGVVSERRLAEALEAIGAGLARLDGRPTPGALVGLGGAVTNLAAVKLGLEPYSAEAVRGVVLDRDEVDRQIELYRTRPARERGNLVGLQPGRAEVILAGACIARTVMGKLGSESLRVSDRGLRHGLLVERFGS